VSGLFYPPRLVLGWLANPEQAHSLFIAGHLWLSGLVTYVLARRLGIGKSGASLSAVAWMFSGYNMAWLHMEMITPVSVFLPLNLLLVELAVRSPHRRWVVVAGLSEAVALLAGNLIVMSFTLLVPGIYGLVLVLRSAVPEGWQSREARRRLARLGGTSVLAVSLPGFLLLPTVIELRNARRQPGGVLNTVFADGLTWTYLRHLLVPQDLPSSMVHLFQMPWAGTLVAILAVAGLISRRPGVILSASLACIGFIMPVLHPLGNLAFFLIPTLRYVSGLGRLFFIPVLGLCLLAGVGLERLQSVLVRLMCRRRGSQAQHIRHFVGWVLPTLVVGATAAQLIPYGLGLNPAYVSQSESALYPETPALAVLRDQSTRDDWQVVMPLTILASQGRSLPTDRSLWAGSPLFGDTHLLFGLKSTSGYDSAVDSRLTTAMRILAGEGIEAALAPYPSPLIPSFSSRWGRLDLAPRFGVTLVYAATSGLPMSQEGWGFYPIIAQSAALYGGRDGRVWRLTGDEAGPRVSQGTVVVNNDSAALHAYPEEKNWADRVVLEEADLRNAGVRSSDLPQSHAIESGRVEWAIRSNNSVEMRLSGGPARFVALPLTFNSGWKAEVDGKEAPVVRADYWRTAVLVPAGAHFVNLKFRPVGWQLGWILTLLAAITSLLLLSWEPLRRASRRTSPLDRRGYDHSEDSVELAASR